jgi:hypothetical protein
MPADQAGRFYLARNESGAKGGWRRCAQPSVRLARSGNVLSRHLHRFTSLEILAALEPAMTGLNAYNSASA